MASGISGSELQELGAICVTVHMEDRRFHPRVVRVARIVHVASVHNLGGGEELVQQRVIARALRPFQSRRLVAHGQALEFSPHRRRHLRQHPLIRARPPVNLQTNQNISKRSPRGVRINRRSNINRLHRRRRSSLRNKRRQKRHIDISFSSSSSPGPPGGPYKRNTALDVRVARRSYLNLR